MPNPEPIVSSVSRADEEAGAAGSAPEAPEAPEAGDSSDRTAERPEPAQDDDIRDSVKRIFNGLIEVKVVTIVEDVELEMATGGGRTVATLKPFKNKVRCLITIFNLVDGDVTNVIAPDLLNHVELRAFHTAQVDKSVAVLPANIAALVKLGKAIIDEF